jgi:hypothetical protein
MSIYAPIEKFLNEVIAEYKMEVRVASNAAGENCALSPQSMKLLVVANARALGAMQALDIIKQTVAYSKNSNTDVAYAENEALPRVIRAVEQSMDIYLNNEESHPGTVRVLNDVLKSLRVAVPA